MSELGKYKICPCCGEKNQPAAMECQKCGADLISVRVIDAATEQRQLEKAERLSEPKSRQHDSPALVKTCECGAINPPQARKCQVCREDISDISPKLQESSVGCFLFESLDSDYRYLLEEPLVIVGREAEMSDYLANRDFVSRRHAKVTVVGPDVYIENLSSTNRTFVNNELLEGNEPTKVAVNDEIGLGGKVINGRRQQKAAYFVLRAVQ
jgi:ribosomal protein L40E